MLAITSKRASQVINDLLAAFQQAKIGIQPTTEQSKED